MKRLRWISKIKATEENFPATKFGEKFQNQTLYNANWAHGDILVALGASRNYWFAAETHFEDCEQCKLMPNQIVPCKTYVASLFPASKLKSRK